MNNIKNVSNSIIKATYENAIDLLSAIYPSMAFILKTILSAKNEYDSLIMKETIETLSNQVNKLEEEQKTLLQKWVESEEGKRFNIKLLSVMINAEYFDKSKYFINVFFNGMKENININMKNKYLEIMKSLSTPAIDVLCSLDKVLRPIYIERKKHGISTPTLNEDSKAETNRLLGWNKPYLVEACIKELVNNGLFSTATNWHTNKNGQVYQAGGYDQSIVYSDFTVEFIDFCIRTL